MSITCWNFPQWFNSATCDVNNAVSVWFTNTPVAKACGTHNINVVSADHSQILFTVNHLYLVKDCLELEEGFGHPLQMSFWVKQSVDLRDVREKERKTEERCWTGAGQVHQGITAFGEVGKEGGVRGWSCGMVWWTWSRGMSNGRKKGVENHKFHASAVTCFMTPNWMMKPKTNLPGEDFSYLVYVVPKIYSRQVQGPVA